LFSDSSLDLIDVICWCAASVGCLLTEGVLSLLER